MNKTWHHNLSLKMANTFLKFVFMWIRLSKFKSENRWYILQCESDLHHNSRKIIAHTLLHGWAELKCESSKVTDHKHNASQHHFYWFLKETWLLKSSCSLTSPTHAVAIWGRVSLTFQVPKWLTNVFALPSFNTNPKHTHKNYFKKMKSNFKMLRQPPNFYEKVKSNALDISSYLAHLCHV